MFLSVPADSIDVAPPWDRPPDAWLERLDGIPAALVGDVLNRMTVMDGGVRLLTDRATLIGFALPVDTREGDNLAVHRALDEARPGDVLVVNGRGDTTRALIGDLIGEIMVGAGVRGAVIDGAVRDVTALGELGLTVYARATTPAGPYKTGPGTVGATVAAGGIVVGPGDIIIGDADGVVVVPVSKVQHVSDEWQAALGRENQLRSRIRQRPGGSS
ncbi:RraA family protein [Jiangella endophytica]|uniref:RraA family protein n=1 Tax=Jiangella endophytica TaxID=1623398 RepID=UPI000E34CCBF|nr:RraA family protein [Jiangella endophytica]